MKVPDANVLLYAVNTTSAHHDRARRWLETELSGVERVGFSPLVLTAFIRISTNASVFAAPLAVKDAFDQVQEWLAPAGSVIVNPGAGHLGLMRELLASVGTAGNLTNDAHLAALAIEHGATLASFDGDFHRFGGLSFEYLNAPDSPGP